MRGVLVSLSSSLPLLWPQTNELESLVSFHFPKQTDNPRLKRLSVKTFKGSVDFAKCHKPSFLNCGQRRAHRALPIGGSQAGWTVWLLRTKEFFEWSSNMSCGCLNCGRPWERGTGVSARPSPAIHSPKQGWKDTVYADDDDDDNDDEGIWLISQGVTGSLVTSGQFRALLDTASASRSIFGLYFKKKTIIKRRGPKEMEKNHDFCH